MKRLIAAFALVGVFVYSNPSWAEMSSTSYQIEWDSITAGGSDTSTSESYGVRDSVGSAAIGASSSDSYELTSGYRAGITDQILTFDIYLQNSQSQRALSSVSSTTASVTTTTDVSVGDQVAIVQDIGASQVTAIGRVISYVTDTSITVDRWATNGTSPTIDGTNDFLFVLDGSAVSLGQLSALETKTAIIGFEVTADIDAGYTIQVVADGGFTTGSETLTDVADGVVSTGGGEVGAISSDSSVSGSTFDTQDTAIGTSYANIVSEASARFYDRHFLTLKASLSEGSGYGTYAQTITLIAAGNY